MWDTCKTSGGSYWLECVVCKSSAVNVNLHRLHLSAHCGSRRRQTRQSELTNIVLLFYQCIASRRKAKCVGSTMRTEAMACCSCATVFVPEALSLLLHTLLPAHIPSLVEYPDFRVQASHWLRMVGASLQPDLVPCLCVPAVSAAAEQLYSSTP